MIQLDALPLLPLDTSRPFALLADIHANIEALHAVGEWLDRHDIAEAVVIGDLIGYGASPQEAVDFVRERDWSAVRGNHEDMLLDLSHVERTRSLKSSARRALEWTRRELDAEAVRFFESLPLAAWIGREAIAVHGSLVDPRHCYAYIYEFSLDLNANCLRELDPPAGTLVCFGHTHRPVAFSVGAENCTELTVGEGVIALPGDSYHLVNPGSVGFSRDRDPRASFMVLDAASRRIEHVRIKYDAETAANKMRDAGYAAGLAERLIAAR